MQQGKEKIQIRGCVLFGFVFYEQRLPVGSSGLPVCLVGSGLGGTAIEVVSRLVKNRRKNTNTVYSRIYMEFRKMVMVTLYVRQQKRHRCREQFFGLCGRGQGWDDLEE